jgi:hypothetical protein
LKKWLYFGVECDDKANRRKDKMPNKKKQPKDIKDNRVKLSFRVRPEVRDRLRSFTQVRGLLMEPFVATAIMEKIDAEQEKAG